MRGLFSRSIFTGFGPRGVVAPAGSLFRIQGTRPARLKALVRHHAPKTPGVYGMVNLRGELIYVGKAKSLRARLMSYFRTKSRDPKAGRIIEQTRLLVWEPGHSEFAALIRELELIRRWRPRCNVQGQPRGARRGYVCIGRRPAPYVFLSSKPTSTALAFYGPVHMGSNARDAVRWINQLYKLRDCPQAQRMVFADQTELFPMVRAAGCLRHEIGTCSGPCAAGCTRAAYADQVNAAQRFLEGQDVEVLVNLEREMICASTDLNFERAAILRDRLRVLLWLMRQLERVRAASRRSLVYTLPGANNADIWYLIHQGRAVASVPAPSDPISAAKTQALLEKVYLNKSALPGALSLEEIDGVLLVDSWFRKHKEEHARTRSPGEMIGSLTLDGASQL